MLRHDYENAGYLHSRPESRDLMNYQPTPTSRAFPNSSSKPPPNPRPPVLGRRKEALIGGSSFARNRNVKSLPDLDIYPTRDVTPSGVYNTSSPAKQTYLWDDFLRDTPGNTKWTNISHTCYDYPTLDSSTPDSPWFTISPNRSAPSVLDSYPNRAYRRENPANRSLPLLDGMEQPKVGHNSSSDAVLTEDGALEVNQSTLSSTRGGYNLGNESNVMSPRTTSASTTTGRNLSRSILSAQSPTTVISPSYGTGPRLRTSPQAVDHSHSTQSPRSLEETDSSGNSKTPINKQNGILRTLSKRSLDLSKPSLNLSRVTLYSNTYGIPKSIASLALMGTTSLITAIFGLLLMFQLQSRQNSVFLLAQSALDNSSRSSALEVAVALTSFVIMFDLSCMTVCAVQCFFTAKLLKAPQGEERAFQYLKDCAATRFISIAAFFLSIPFLLLAVMLYVLMEYHTTPAVIGGIIMSAGILFVVCSLIHSTVRWRIHKTRANNNSPARKPRPNELSTLV